MTGEPGGIGESVPNLNNAQVEWAHHTARLLEQRGLTAKVTPLKETQADWYLSATLAFRPPPQTRAPLGSAADALVEALSRQDSVLDQIEQATGLAAEFKDHGNPGADLVCVSLSRSGAAIGEIVPLAMPPKAVEADSLSPFPLIFAATRLSLDEAGQLSAGDLLLLSCNPWPLVDHHAAQSGAALAYDPQSGLFGPTMTSNLQSPEATPMTDPADGGQMTVPVAIHLPDAMLTQTDLGKLAEAGSVDLGPVAEGLHVTISVGGRPVGRGEIVRVGDRFAALLEDPAPAAPQSESENEGHAGATASDPPPNEQSYQPDSQFEAEPE